MAILHSQTIIFFVQFLFLHFHFSSPYNLPDHYFINCGSASTATINNQNFTGDTNSRLLSTTSETITNPNSLLANAALYGTARVFKNPAAYNLQLSNIGYYIVRFHFYPFLYLSDAQFSISASGFNLLYNFSVLNYTYSPIIQEFLLKINSTKFTIYFTPSNSSSIAFVNAIEAFITPENFIPDYVSSVNADDSGQKIFLTHVLHTIHRINVGGSILTIDNDTLLRNWVPDDDYLYSKIAARNATPRENKPNYQENGANEFTAPDYVYQTAKQLNRESNQQLDIHFNITWRFSVTKKASHFVRAHFCDIVSDVQQYGKFNFFVDGKLGPVIDPISVYPQLAAPFYTDVAVESDDSGFMNVSIGPDADSQKIPFLNGLEIMEIMTDNPAIVPKLLMKHHNHMLVIIGGVFAGMVLFILLFAVLWWFKCSKTEPDDNFDQPLVLVYGGNFSYGNASSRTVNSSPRAVLNLGLKLSLKDILYATKNFNPKLMIGEGGFGKVYKGILRTGIKVAVKRSEPGHGQGLSEFETEVTVLSKIRHVHLVSLIGYCDEGSEMILVYEFMEKGTLREHLYGSNQELDKLSWNKRLEICIGAAKGIHYLHTCLDGGIIHRDVKSTNILLDKNYVAKVADFGLSRLGPPDHTHVSTEVKGSFGYLDPEYLRCLQLTQKSDVYSFGVVLLEVLCARPPISNLLPCDEDIKNLADWGIYWQQKRELEKIVDPFLLGKIKQDSLRKFGETVEKCLRDCGAERPSMLDVIWDLEYVNQLQQTKEVAETEEDSVNDDSWDQLALPLFGVNANTGLSSTSFSVEVNEVSISTTGSGNESRVFSQLKADDAR